MLSGVFIFSAYSMHHKNHAPLCSYKQDTTTRVHSLEKCLSDIQHPQMTMLMKACTKGCETCVTRLINQGHDMHEASSMNCGSYEGLLPLLKASYMGHKNIVSLFIAHNVNVNRTDKDGRTALFSACTSGHADIAHLLLRYGADHSIAHSTYNTFPLHKASGFNSPDVIQALLIHGAYPNVKNMVCKTPIDRALDYEYIDNAILLYAHGCTIPEDTLLTYMWSHTSYDMLTQMRTYDTYIDNEKISYKELYTHIPDEWKDACIHRLFTMKMYEKAYNLIALHKGIENVYEYVCTRIHAGSYYLKDHYKELADTLRTFLTQHGQSCRQIRSTFMNVYTDITYAPFIQYMIGTYEICVNATDNRGFSLLERAIIADRIDIVIMLLGYTSLNTDILYHKVMGQTSVYDYIKKYAYYPHINRHIQHIIHTKHTRDILSHIKTDAKLYTFNSRPHTLLKLCKIKKMRHKRAHSRIAHNHMTHTIYNPRKAYRWKMMDTLPIDITQRIVSFIQPTNHILYNQNILKK
jgi:ankyrin repeat protein